MASEIKKIKNSKQNAPATLMTVLSDRKLTVNEQLRLAELQSIIYRNFKAFYTVGCALLEIRDRRLYRETHDTFEAFCRERFEIARRTAYQYIKTSTVMDNLKNCAQCAQIEYLPANEAQVRPLCLLDPEKQIKAWTEAMKTAPDGRVTAKHVNKVVRGFLGEEIRQKAERLKDKDASVNIVSRKFREAYWALVEIVRSEMTSGSLKEKVKKQMLKNIQGLAKLLSD